MSIMKYILFALLLFGLWVTEPLWLKKGSDTMASPVDKQIDVQNNERAKALASQAAKMQDLEEKYGPKPYGRHDTGVPSSVYASWEKTLAVPESLEEERCGPVRAGARGWMTVCRYRAKSSSGALELRQDTFFIKDGIAFK